MTDLGVSGGNLPGVPASRTELTSPSTRPGLRLPGRVTLVAGAEEALADRVVLGLVGKVERADGGQTLVEFHRVPVTGAVRLDPGERRVLPFALPVPWECPLTVLAGVAPLSVRLGLRTTVVVDPVTDEGALRPVFVYPLPAQEGILSALTELGFGFRQAGLRAGRLPGVAQTLPFHQVIGFWAAPLYAGPISELELVFVTDRYGVEVLFWLDRRLALSGAGHTSISRFRVNHVGADEADWPSMVDRWVRRAVDRHAAAASAFHSHPHLVESPHVSRPPEHISYGGDPGATAGGSSGGGGDGT